MTTELVLLGTAAAPMPVAGRGGIAAALVRRNPVFVIDCGRGASSAFVNAGLDFRCLDAIFITHLHADHVGDLPGMLLYPWGVRTSADGPLPPVQVYGPGPPATLPSGDNAFHRETTIHPERPAPGTRDLVEGILAGYAYHLNVMLLDRGCPIPESLCGPPTSRCRYRPMVRPSSRLSWWTMMGPGDRHRRHPWPRRAGLGLPVRYCGRFGRFLRGHHHCNSDL